MGENVYKEIVCNEFYREKEYEEFKEKFKNKFSNFIFFKNSIPFSIDLDKYLEKNKIYPGEQLNFMGHGCAGDAREKQKQIAKIIDEELEKDVSFNFLLGDNFYLALFGSSGLRSLNHGIQSNDLEIANTMKTYFHDIYNTNKKNSIFFCVLGNHDYNYWSHGGTLGVGESGPELALKQVNATYNPLVKVRLPTWLMPHRYYLLFSKKFNTAFFCLDSNTFLWDFLQRDWLNKAYIELDKLYPDCKKIIVQHHPFQSFGKRWEHEKIKMYKPKETFSNGSDGIRVAEENTNIGIQIYNYLQEKNLVFQVLLCAHDHYLDVRKLDKDIYQCISGSGNSEHTNAKQGKTYPKEAAENHLDGVLKKNGGDLLREFNEKLRHKNGAVKISIDSYIPSIYNNFKISYLLEDYNRLSIDNDSLAHLQEKIEQYSPLDFKTTAAINYENIQTRHRR